MLNPIRGTGSNVKASSDLNHKTANGSSNHNITNGRELTNFAIRNRLKVENG